MASHNICAILACLLCVSFVNCRDIFTAYNHMKQLASVELELHGALERYLESEEQRLKELHEFSESIVNVRKLNTSVIEDYAGNPISAYLMLKRFVEKWSRIGEMMEGKQDLILGQLTYYGNLLPSETDVDGALKAIVRIQETYHLLPSYISSGLREKPVDDTQLGVVDVYRIGREAYLNGNYHNTKLWMEEAKRLLNGSLEKDDINLADVLDHLSWVEFKLGNLDQAINYTTDWIKVDPTNDRAKKNLRYIQNERERIMGQNSEKIKKPKARVKKLKPHQRPKYDFGKFDWPTERENYKRLCRGDEILTYEEQQNVSKLICSYYTKHPLLKIRPAKMEQVFEKPPIYIFHEFASEADVEDLKHISGPKLSRATVHNPTTGVIEYANYRISEFSWLGDEDGETVAKINARLDAVTKLNVKTAEGLQVQNYGMAGQYDPHFDFSRLKLEKARAVKEHEKELIKDMGDGNRIATALLYMNQVEAGGATVFPYVGARLTPLKGDVVFWHNLMRSGDGDFRTRHAGCPVISGSKWVANKWFHEVGNEFRRPCGLSPDE